MSRPPLWTAIAGTIRQEIAAGHYRAGERLPTEADLAARFGVNRHTVRRALADLAQEGVVYARRGAGVFVRQSPTDYPIGRRVRFHQNILAAGRAPRRKPLLLETRQGDARECEALQLDAGASVHVFEGLSYIDGVPVALFRSVFPAARFARMLACLRADPSVTSAFAAHALNDYERVSTRINAKVASATLAAHLNVQVGDPVLRTISLNADAQGVPIEYGRTWFAGDRVTLTLARDGQ